ncbi:MAG TPA: hypothetical protein VFW85_10830 [Gaiellaceae bacterium]|nr:hypothetical protein [Gaiellaceae bacterium]
MGALALVFVGLQLALPHGWHGLTTNPKLATCDPMTLAVVGTRQPRITSSGWVRPAAGQVLVFVEEDHVNKPYGNLRRPERFRIHWDHFDRLEGCCGLPAMRGQTIWFRQGGRYLGFIVYAGRGVSTKTRAATQRLLDSFRVT